jgi:hypothetical protein
MNFNDFKDQTKEIFLHNERSDSNIIWNNEMIDAELKILYDNQIAKIYEIEDRLNRLEKR